MTSGVRVRYQTIEFGEVDIHLCTLRDRQQFADPQGEARRLGISSANWSLFGIIWPSAMVLAHYLAVQDLQGRRILEIGCGMALSSLLLNRLGCDITATDYHPEAGRFLQRNTELNHDREIRYQRADWADDSDGLGRFDLIIGSDLLYEDPHVTLVADFINRHARPGCEVILVDPGRGRKNRLTRQMEACGFSHAHIRPEQTSYLDKPFKGHILRFRREPD